MIEQQIEELKNALRQVMQMIADRNEPLSEELKTALAQVMEHVANRIQELRQQEARQIEGQVTPPQGPPPIEPGPFPSSNINGFNYDYDSGKLLVKFQDKYPGTNGAVYAYENVPRFIYDVFRKGAVAPKTSGKNRWHTWRKGVTPSLGAAMYHLIRNGGYSYQRLQ